MLSRIRGALHYATLKKLASCFYCLSIWVAMPFSLFLKGDVVETLVGWLALSGGAILLERVTRERLELKIDEGESWDVAAKR